MCVMLGQHQKQQSNVQEGFTVLQEPQVLALSHQRFALKDIFVLLDRRLRKSVEKWKHAQRELGHALLEIQRAVERLNLVL